MNRGRMLFGFGVALAVALLASVYVYHQLQHAQAPTVKVVKQLKVVVAATAVSAGQQLTAEQLTVLDWPEGKQPQGSFSRVQDAVGRAVITPLVQGELVLDEKLAKREGGVGLPVTIPAGMRAVTVAVDPVIAVAGFVTAGTIVDVLVTGVGANGPVTRTILEHVRVLASGQDMTSTDGKPQMTAMVTLLVSPQDGEKLTLAQVEGKIHLSLRNTIDLADANPTPVYASSEFTGMAPAPATARVFLPKPAPAPAVPFSVQVIRGDKVETQTFPR